MRPPLSPVFWRSGQFAADFTEVPIGTPVNTYLRSEQAYGSAGVRRGRITHSAGAEGNDRRTYLLPEFDRDTRMLVVWQDKPLKSAGGAQMGHFHRVRLDPDGFYRGWIVRHDFTFGQDAFLAAELWRWNSTTLTIVAGAGNIELPGIARRVSATDASRTANVVTAVGLPAGHGIVPTHTVTADFADNSYDTNAVVSGPASPGTTLVWPQTAADDPSAGAGTILDLDGVLPVAVESILIGSELAVRAWRLDQDPVPSWTDPNKALIFRDTTGADPYPARRGRCGVYIGHLVGGFVEFGPIERERIR